MYECGLKSSYADYDAMVEFDQMLFSLPCGLNTSSISVAFLWYRSKLSSSSSKKFSKFCRYMYMTSSPVRYCFPAKCCFFINIREQKIVRWCQIRKIWRVINQFKATVMHSSHCNHRLVCMSIVLVKQDSLRQVFQAVSEMSQQCSTYYFSSPYRIRRR